MIFVTVGHQMPFDRLIKAIDQWAHHNNQTNIFAQIGSGEYKPKHIEWAPTLAPDQFMDHMNNAQVVVGHAGMGTILNALELGKPILVMPRRGDLQETRNDHQIATAERFQAMGKVSVAMNEQELPKMLDQVSNLTPSGIISPQASPELLEALAAFVNQADT